jgi:hypothetical protein
MTPRRAKQLSPITRFWSSSDAPRAKTRELKTEQRREAVMMNSPKQRCYHPIDILSGGYVYPSSPAGCPSSASRPCRYGPSDGSTISRTGVGGGDEQ